MSSDALYFLLGAVLAGLLGTSVWALDGSRAAALDLDLALNGVTVRDR